MKRGVLLVMRSGSQPDVSQPIRFAGSRSGGSRKPWPGAGGLSGVGDRVLDPALVSPARVIAVTAAEYLQAAPMASLLEDWSLAWNLAVELAGDRHNAMPNPKHARRSE
jgi:hypothetical protein